MHSLAPGSRAWTAGRLIVAGFCWFTAAYACVASSTFASLQFLQPRVFPWVGTFSDWHTGAGGLCLALAGALLWHDVRRRDAAGRLALGLLTLLAAAVVWNAVSPLLPTLAGGTKPLVVAVLAFAVPLAFAAVDHAAVVDRVRHCRPSGLPTLNDHESRLLVVAVGAALLVTALYAAFASATMAGAFEPDLLTEGLTTGLVWSLVDHLWIACAAFLTFAVIGRVTGRRSGWHYAALFAVLSAALAFTFARLVGVSLGMHGVAAALVAAAFGTSVTGTWGALRLRSVADHLHALSPLDVFLGEPRPGGAWRAALPVLASVAVAVLGAAISRLADWDFVLLKSGVLAVWITAFGSTHRMTTRRWRVPAWGIALACLMPLAAQQTLQANTDQRRMLARYEVYNPSFRLAHGLLHDVAATPSFDRFLRTHSTIDAAIAPVAFDFVPRLAPSNLPVKPLIFVFVVDSLRPDYLGAYNPAVRFTPHLDQFASESVVFRNAFTRFGGTGLSVPAIWAGGVLPHTQYVEPFYPRNTLEKLLDVNGYRKMIGLDSMVGHRLCGTLGQIKLKLMSADPAEPVFAYSLPQDVHMSRLPARVEPGPEYQGFHAAYATKVHAIDDCFGRFVDMLKARGLYDRSLIVLTSDHGEMLGEDGRFGHGTHLFPQVIRVPLIMHLPAELRERAETDVDAVAFSTDITPTIYSALGYRPSPANPLMGRSLVDVDAQAAALRRREPVVIASSYGPVYAVLQDNGQELYIADAQSGTDLAYARDAVGGWSAIEVTAAARTANQFLIRQHIDEVSRVFHMDDAPAHDGQH